MSAAFGDLRKAEEVWSESSAAALGEFYDGYTRGAAPEGFHAGSDLLHLMPDKATFLVHAHPSPHFVLRLWETESANHFHHHLRHIMLSASPTSRFAP